jgi:nucleoside-diphosphate-sugar epimerase
VDDCLEGGLIRIMASGHRAPVNLGTDDLVTINELVNTVARIAGQPFQRQESQDLNF